MNIKELKQLIKDIPNDFEVVVLVEKGGTPFNFETCKTDKKSYDIGHSDKKFQISIELNKKKS